MTQTLICMQSASQFLKLTLGHGQRGYEHTFASNIQACVQVEDICDEMTLLGNCNLLKIAQKNIIT